MIRNSWWLMALGMSLAGCASQSNVYYTLTASTASANASVQQGNSSTTRPLALYTLSSVSVPAPADDTLLVVRRSDDQLMKLAHDRWTAPLGKQFGNALAVALTNELGMPPISKTQASGDARVTTISVDVQRFDLVPGKYAELAAVWQLAVANQKGGMGKPVVCYTQERLPVEPGVAPLVQAQQQNIIKLASAIASGWQTGQPGASTRCQ